MTSENLATPETPRDVLHVPADGAPIAGPQDALDLIGEAWGSAATTIVVPVERFDAAFFDLKSGLLGEITQKFVNYGIRLVVLGNIGENVAASSAFGDYVRETNGGDQIRFVPNLAALGR